MTKHQKYSICKTYNFRFWTFHWQNKMYQLMGYPICVKEMLAGIEHRYKLACTYIDEAKYSAHSHCLVSLNFPHEETLDTRLRIKRPPKTLIRFGGCAGWSESSMGAHANLYFCCTSADLTLYLVLRINLHPYLVRTLQALAKSSIICTGSYESSLLSPTRYNVRIKDHMHYD